MKTFADGLLCQTTSRELKRKQVLKKTDNGVEPLLGR